jgi:4-diphosphocytidyl-2-C-methyl-D-erythritol kinase
VSGHREIARAKTNLFLEVPRRRDDGFHELDTVFIELATADTLEFERSQEPGVVLEIEGDAELSAGPDNLVVRAGEALRTLAGEKAESLGARVLLRKEIPQGGGLGGGSSDAAAALRGLDALWELQTPAADLARIAAELGSDVAFFLEGGVQRGRGRGEVLEPLPLPPAPLELVLILPGFPSPTPAVYKALAPHLPSEPLEPSALLSALAAGDATALGAALFNRLEAPAFDLYPDLAAFREQLAAAPEAEGVLLSGSGSTLIALCAERAGAEALAARLQAEPPAAFPQLRAFATQSVG